jgi:hypothetical protein
VRQLRALLLLADAYLGLAGYGVDDQQMQQAAAAYNAHFASAALYSVLKQACKCFGSWQGDGWSMWLPSFCSSPRGLT